MVIKIKKMFIDEIVRKAGRKKGRKEGWKEGRKEKGRKKHQYEREASIGCLSYIT